MWQTVTIQQPDAGRTPMGAPLPGWSDVTDLVDVPARIISVMVEDPQRDMTLVEDRYQVVLEPSGQHTEITSEMRVLDGSTAYDIRQVHPRPLGILSAPVVVDAVKVTV